MEHRDNQDSGQSPDVSKVTQAQQPRNEHPQPAEEEQAQAEFGQAPSPSETGQAGFGENQSDTATQQRSDVEGSSLDQTGSSATGQASDIEGSSSFVGAEGSTDTSRELIEDEDTDFTENDQGAPD